ncbi:MAG: hydroxymethylbilane synthase [Pseudomonadota bacterium]|nr:hydroxymethylbilane synthase [Pseudomonadota bacterium]
MKSLFRIATRSSPLALAQANEVKDALTSVDPTLVAEKKIEIKTFKTSGDLIQIGSLAEAGGKGLFTKEVEAALLKGEAEIAVHSMKDMPSYLPDGLVIGAFLKRQDPRDALISRAEKNLSSLRPGSIVGTASLRRKAILLRKRPDVRTVSLRGNVETRLKKVKEGVVDATFLAIAGLKRLGMVDHVSNILEPEEMLPAVCQGVIGIECRKNDLKTLSLIRAIDDLNTRYQTQAERAFLKELDGSCQTPIAGLATLKNEKIFMRAMILKPDGSECHQSEGEGSVGEASDIGIAVAQEIRARAGKEFLNF